MNLLKKIKKLRHDAIITFTSLKKLQTNKIIMWSNSFKSYGCNPKYLAEYILKNFPNQYDIVWVVDSLLPIPNDIPVGIRIVKYFSIEYLKELHTAKYIVCNSRTSDAYMWHKRKGQVYIQTWHSSLRLKSIEGDAASTLPASYIENAKADSKKIDVLISGCKFSTNIFKNSFWYDGEIFECGTPRIDFLLQNHNRHAILNKIGLDKNYKYILYSPTFRDTPDFEYKLDFKSIISACTQRFGGEWKVLYRLHPNLIFKITKYNLDDECINVCSYPDIQELIIASDLMITDYSSCMFDTLYINKPCILYIPDYENYVKNERKLYFDMNLLPFLQAYTQKQIIDSIKSFRDAQYKNNLLNFKNKIGSFENGTACQQIVEKILKRK